MSDFGLPDSTLSIVRQILADCPAVDKAILYGSRAMGTYRRGSDIDLTLVGNRLDYATVGELSQKLDESSIPYTVDLSLWTHIDNPNLREHIERVGIVLYDRGTSGEGPQDAPRGVGHVS